MISLVATMLTQLVNNGVQERLQFHGIEMHFMAKEMGQFYLTMLNVWEIQTQNHYSSAVFHFMTVLMLKM